MKILPLSLIGLALILGGCSSNSKRPNPKRHPSSLFGKDSCRSLMASLFSGKKVKSYGDEEMMTINEVEIDVTPIRKYIASSSLNKKLRQGVALEPEEEELLVRLKGSLEKLPSKEGMSFRKITAQPPHNTLDQLLSKYAEGKVVTEEAFTSVALSEQTKVWGDILRADIIMEIEGKTLKDISGINELENEGIFLPGTKFRVKEVIGDYEYNETVEIIEEDALADDLAYYGEFLRKYEDYFGAQGIYAVDMNDKFRGLRDMDYGRFKPVEMDNWEDLVKQKIIPIIRIKLEEIPPEN